MKRIIKGHEPQELLDFKKLNKNVEVDYNSLGARERTPIKESLLNEQGFICAYTLKRINFEGSHIEHVKPEELCRQLKRQGVDTISDLDYSNMVACFPKEFSGSSRKKFYGAYKKDDWWENDGDNFISPLRIDCENHFKYNKDGSVGYLTDKGKKTIEVLNLNHDILKNDRERAINSFIYKDNKPLNQSQTNQAIDSICVKYNNNYREFCVAIRDALKDHLLFLDRIKKKNKIISNAKKRKS